MNIQKYFGADFFECLSVDVPFYITTKRTRKSVDVSISWLDKCLKLQDEVILLSCSRWQKTCMFGVIQGGGDVLQRARSAKETAKRNVAGFVLGGFGLGETTEQRTQLINTIMVSQVLKLFLI